jgi:hypothetical protein
MHIKHAVSTDGGLTFSAEQAVLPVSGYTYASGQIDTYSMPVGDADITGGPFDGNIYIAFTNRGDEDLSEDRTDVDFIRSTDGGLTWSDRYQINDPPDAAEMDAFHPWLIVNEEGVLVVIFYDQRYDPRRYFLFDCIAAYSFDGGETFTTNHRISDVSSSPQDLDAPLDPVPAAAFTASAGGPAAVLSSASMAGLIAEYIGVSAFEDKIVGVWTDSRDLNSEVYTATWQLPLLEPRLIAPDTNSIHSMQPLLKWSTGWKHDQDSYRVEMSPTDDFSASVISATVDTNFHLPEPPLTNGLWYWRVKAFNLTTGDSSGYSPVWNFTMEGSYECGDVDGSGQVDALDVDYFIDWLYRGGTGPVTLAVADVNGDDNVDVLDIDYFIDWLYRGGPDLNCW